MSHDICVFRDPIGLTHVAPRHHPENPERLGSILSLFEEDPVLRALPSIPAGPASELQLRKLHAKEMVNRVISAKGKNGWFDADTFYCPMSVEAALVAAGGCIELASRIWKGEYRRGFSLVRPRVTTQRWKSPWDFVFLTT